MIQIYPTIIDSYEYYLASEMSLQDILDRINRVERPISEAALRGSALNECIDQMLLGRQYVERNNRDQSCYVHRHKEKDYYFPASLCRGLYDHVIDSLQQVRVEKEIMTSRGLVKLYGYIDYLRLNKITDLKTTSRYTFPKYQHNFQYKAYLYCLQDTGVNEFEYLVTDFSNIYIEKYDWNSYTLQSLRSQLEDFLYFVDKHRDRITDEKILGI